MSLKATRSVREDQHGTITGYVYGCRCEPCRMARRDYREGRDDKQFSPETLERVYAALEHEADMDGLVIASGERLGELADVSAMTTNHVIHNLQASGRIRVVGRAGRGGSLQIQLEEW